MKRLIVNADDFGFTRGVNAGIIRAFREGIVTSATLMANGDAFDDAVELARSNPGLGVGCHLALVGGRPLSRPDEIPSLVDDRGLLPPTLSKLLTRLARGVVRTDDLVRELRAQVQRLLTAGIAPTHLDSHKHSHVAPPVMRAIAVVANEFGVVRVRNPFERVLGRRFLSIPPSPKQALLSAAVAPGLPRFKRLAARHGLRTTDHFFGVKLTGLLDTASIRSIIELLSEGTSELMCHPGLYDSELERSPTRLKRERQRELEALSDPALKRLADARGVTLISYREL